MENLPPQPARGDPPVPTASVSDALNPPLIDPPPDAGADRPPGRACRIDGWTPERIRIFLETLAACGVVADACRAAGISRMSAYRMRDSAAGRPFMLAWRAAMVRASRRLGDELMSRALNGCVERIYRDGKLWGERHVYDNRLTLNMFERLEKILARDGPVGAVGAAAEEFEQLVDIVSEGGERAANFVRNRVCGGDRDSEVRQLKRADNYRRGGVGLRADIDISDLERTDPAHWTEEQRRRAILSGFAEAARPKRRDDAAGTGGRG